MTNYDKAIHARNQYRIGAMTKAQAVEFMSDYINEFNDKAREIARKYNQRPKLFSFAAFVR